MRRRFTNTRKRSKLKDLYKLSEVLPVLWSPAVYKSDDVFEYEKPTPAGDSRNSKFATAQKEINKLEIRKGQMN